MIGVCGEALIDFTPVEADSEVSYTPRPGGSPCNVAIGLARLGKRAAFIGKISSDRFGDMLHTNLQMNGVDLNWTVRGGEPTALAFVIPDGDGGHEFAFYGEKTAEQSISNSDLPDSFPNDVIALHFGSYSLMLGAGAGTYEQLMRRECGRRVISLDPNVRPALFPERKLYRERIEELVRLATIVKASEDDLSWLYPNERVVNVAARWREMGPSLIVVTLGASGAIGMSGDAIVSSPGVRADIADTVGAGDAFMSALLEWLEDRGFLHIEAIAAFTEDEIADALAYANTAAAITCYTSRRRSPYAASDRPIQHFRLLIEGPVRDFLALDTETIANIFSLGQFGRVGNGADQASPVKYQLSAAAKCSVHWRTSEND